MGDDLGRRFEIVADPLPTGVLAQSDDGPSYELALAGVEAGNVFSDDLFESIGEEFFDLHHRVGELRVSSGTTPEEQVEGILVVLHEAEVSPKSGLDLAVGILGGRGGRQDRLLELTAGVFQQLPVKGPLRLEVLVEHRLRDAGPIRDVVHRRAVETAVGEDLKGDVKQLPPPLWSGKADSPPGVRSGSAQ